jgi:TldD protein
VDIVGTPLASFAKILATSDRAVVFNGYCGAESGQVPVSASSPALLVSEIEIQKKQHGQDRPPFLGRPAETGVRQ